VLRRGLTGTQELCDFVSSLQFADIPGPVVEYAKLLVLDGIGCALLASNHDWSERAVRSVVELEGGGGVCSVWGYHHRVSPPVAALLNGTLIQGFELDDYHPTGPLHSAACVLPAVYALCEHLGDVSGSRLLTAVVAGFEIGPRVGIASGGLRLVELGFHSGSVFGSVAAAAGAGRLLGLSSQQCNDALGIGATQAAGLMGAQFGSMVKRMHSGRASQSGVYAAQLAAHGYTGIRDVFELPYGGFTAFTGGQQIDLPRLTARLGEDWELCRIAIKPPYACMAGLHSSLDAIKLARTDGHEIHPDEVMSVDIGVSTAMFRHAGWAFNPDAGVMAAQMNLQYAVARMIADGELFVEQFTAQKVADPALRPLISRIRPYPDEGIDALGQAGRWAVRMDIRRKGRRVLRLEVARPWGSEARPLTRAEISDKFHRMASSELSATQAGCLEAAVESIEQLPDVSVLGELLDAGRRQAH
jgi:aconitate decarboxylase